MAYDNRDAIDFGTTPVAPLFRSIFVPTLLGMLFNVAFLLTDGIFIGIGVGAYGLACVNLVAPIMMVVTGLGMMFGVGASVIAAIHLSRSNEKAARINVTQAYYACIVIAMVMGITFYCYPEGTLQVLGVSEQLIGMAKEYYLWFVPTCLFLMFQIVGEFVIRLDGSPRYAMYANIVPALCNMALDYIFILPCGWGLKGAALATDIGTLVGALMTLYYMLFRAKTLRFYRLKATIVSLRLSLRNVGNMIKMGLSAFVGEFAISVLMMTGNIAIGRYLGDDGIAAFSVICYLMPVVTMVYNAVAQSAQPILSFNFGASLTKRVSDTLKISIMVSEVFGVAVGGAFILLAPEVVSIFLREGVAAYPIAVGALPYLALSFPLMAYNISVIGYFQSIERGHAATLLMTLRGVVMPVIAFNVMPLMAGTTGLWASIAVSEIVVIPIEAVMLHRTKRKESK